MGNKKQTYNFTKRNSKASVFTHLFSIPIYSKELYLCLFPNDKNIKEKDISVYNLSNILTNSMVNDLGLLARNIVIVLSEAQSSWSLNVIVRMIEYFAESINRYVFDTNQNIYGSKKVKIPKPKFYIIYTGKQKISKNKITLRKDFFNDNTIPIDIEIQVITLTKHKNIINEYIMFSKIFDKNIKKFGYKKKSIEQTINECIKKNILKEYLEDHKKEVYNIMTSVYNQKTATEMYGRERYASGMAKGISKGKLDLLLDFLNDGVISLKEAAARLGVSEAKFKSMANIM